MSNFTVEETNLMCVFEGNTRTELIEDIKRVIPHLQDSEMEELAGNALKKLEGISDEEFLEVVLEPAEDME